MRNPRWTHYTRPPRAEGPALLALALLAAGGCCHGMIPSWRFPPCSAERCCAREEEASAPAACPCADCVAACAHRCGTGLVGCGHVPPSGEAPPAAVQAPHSKFHPLPTRPVFSPLPGNSLIPSGFAGMPEPTVADPQRGPVGGGGAGIFGPAAQPSEPIDLPPPLPAATGKAPAGESAAARRSPSAGTHSGSHTAPVPLRGSGLEPPPQARAAERAAPATSLGPTRSALHRR